MSQYLLPSLLTKTITFKRMNNKHVKGYEIYGLFQDEKYSSGIREELIDSFDNPSTPNVQRTRITLEYNDNQTWELPRDMYIDKDYKFRVYVNNVIMSPLYYQFNKYNRLLTINHNLKPLNANDVIELEYYKDLITKTYSLEYNCSIKIKPIFADTYTYGNHNVII